MKDSSLADARTAGALADQKAANHTPTMIERAADAHRAAEDAFDAGMPELGESYEDWWARRDVVIVRAVIAAMRDPTIRMVAAARDPRRANGSPVSKGVHDTWQAMIDAALAEP
jgi:hypothetical protein